MLLYAPCQPYSACTLVDNVNNRPELLLCAKHCGICDELNTNDLIGLNYTNYIKHRTNEDSSKTALVYVWIQVKKTRR